MPGLVSILYLFELSFCWSVLQFFVSACYHIHVVCKVYFTNQFVMLNSTGDRRLLTDAYCHVKEVSELNYLEMKTNDLSVITDTLCSKKNPS